MVVRLCHPVLHLSVRCLQPQNVLEIPYEIDEVGHGHFHLDLSSILMLSSEEISSTCSVQPYSAALIELRHLTHPLKPCLC